MRDLEKTIQSAGCNRKTTMRYLVVIWMDGEMEPYWCKTRKDAEKLKRDHESEWGADRCPIDVFRRSTFQVKRDA